MIANLDNQRLTELASCAGCAAKMGPDRLAKALAPLTVETHPELIVGLQTSDDAAVYRMSAERAIVQTVDFFPPIVDDPYAYGAIAATNAMSDVFAMNGTVMLALSVAAFPEEMPLESITSIFTGAADKVREAGAIIAGGHTVIDPEPKFGLSVTGEAHPDRIWTKAGAQPGDQLYLTKPLGTGLVTTALKRGLADARDVAAAIDSMTTLNLLARDVAKDLEVHACSDITGFSLAGHSSEMASKSGVRIELNSRALPLLDGALAYARQECISAGLRRNLAYFEGERVAVAEAVDPALHVLCFDPQTSGGLLLAIDPGASHLLETRFERKGLPVWHVGSVAQGTGVSIV